MTNLSLEAVQHVPLFVDWNKHEVQKIARLFNEHHFSKGETVVEEGSFGEIYEWLRDRLYRHGRKFTPTETILRVAGGPIDPEPYLRYLADKNASLAAA